MTRELHPVKYAFGQIELDVRFEHLVGENHTDTRIMFDLRYAAQDETGGEVKFIQFSLAHIRRHMSQRDDRPAAFGG